MNFKLKIFFFTCVLNLFQYSNLLSQNRIIDSLKIALKNAEHDSIRCRVLSSIIELEVDNKVWPQYNDELKSISESNLNRLNTNQSQYKIFKKYQASSFNNQAYLHELHGNISMALECHLKSLKMQEEIQNKSGIANSLSNLGGIYHTKGNIPLALEYYQRSIKLWEELNYVNGLLRALNNLGVIYNKQGDFLKALEYFTKCLKIMGEINDKVGVARALNNIGAIYEANGDPLCKETRELCFQAGQNSALEYYKKGLSLREEMGDKLGIARSLSNIGSIYKTKGDYDEALNYFNKSLKIREEIMDKAGIATATARIGLIYFQKENLNKTLEYFNKSMKISQELGFPENIKEAALGLNKAYKYLGNYKLSLENYELYIQMRDSINNESTRKASIKSQLKYEYEKQAAADSVAHAKESEIKNVLLAKQKVEITAKKNQQYALFGGLSLVIIFAGFMFNRFKVTQKQKNIIEQQKEIVEAQKKLVEEKQKEVLDSIHYAKRIQMALVPSEKYIERVLKKLTHG